MHTPTRKDNYNSKIKLWKLQTYQWPLQKKRHVAKRLHCMIEKLLWGPSLLPSMLTNFVIKQPGIHRKLNISSLKSMQLWAHKRNVLENYAARYRQFIQHEQKNKKGAPPTMDAKATMGPCFPERRMTVELHADNMDVVFASKFVLQSKLLFLNNWPNVRKNNCPKAIA